MDGARGDGSEWQREKGREGNRLLIFVDELGRVALQVNLASVRRVVSQNLAKPMSRRDDREEIVLGDARATATFQSPDDPRVSQPRIVEGVTAVSV